MHTRKGLTAAIVGVISIALAVGAVGGALAANSTVSAKLSGKAEVPGPGDDDGSGEADLTLKKKKKKISFNISFERIGSPVAGHIHKGTKKVAGPIKVPLFDNPAGVPSPVSGTVTAKKKLIKKIQNDPKGWYVNLHTPDFAAGAIRGQLTPGG
jgi:hypothetical protein